MKGLMTSLLGILFLFYSIPHQAQTPEINPKWTDGFWDAFWITHPTASSYDYGVYHFRKSFNLKEIPSKFVVHVSGDNRYKLFVNGKETCLGPARGDLQHWRFETIDIAAHLKEGTNVLAAVVWNFGEHSPVAQITFKTGFILQGDGDAEKIVNTDASWSVFQNPAYTPETESSPKLNAYIVVGPGDIIDGKKYPWGWEKPEFTDDHWLPARTLSNGQTFGRGTDGNWLLMPRDIPLMEHSPQRFREVRRSEGISVPQGFIRGKSPLTVAPQKKVVILLDQGALITGYPDFHISGGEGATLRVTYSEALFDEAGNKGNRNEIEGKSIKGYTDIFYPDGGSDRKFMPLWLRTWRYMQLEIQTGKEDLIINDIQPFFTGYPFDKKAEFQSDQKWISDVWDVGWRTARMCAGETYYDCPYYEQLQYTGDTRIQALISLYMTGDDRLVRRAINDFEQSRIWNGLSQSRYPCKKLQIIPPYSLFWIAMVHDYWMYRDDPEYIRSLLPGVRSILGWYESQINEKQLFGRSKWWNFVDWTDEWAWNPVARIGGIPDLDPNGNSSILSLHYAYTLQYAAELHRAFGEDYYADKYDQLYQQTTRAVHHLCWDETKQIYSDLPGGSTFSQHANILAVLTDALPENQQIALMEKVLNDKSLIQATFYFKFYLFRAMVKTGMADQYLPQLAPWRNMLDLGLTTFAEKPDPTRSDCHAWSASPILIFWLRWPELCRVPRVLLQLTSLRHLESLPR